MMINTLKSTQQSAEVFAQTSHGGNVECLVDAIIMRTDSGTFSKHPHS